MLSTQSPSSGILQLNLKPDNNMGFKPSALAQDRFCCSQNLCKDGGNW